MMNESPYTPEQIAEARKIVASEAARKRWAKTPKSKRKGMGSAGGKKRAAKLSKKRLTAIARKGGKAGGNGRPKAID